MTTVFVVFEGATPGERNPAAAFSTEQYARQSFDLQVEEGLVNVNRGLFLGRLDDVSDDDLTNVYDNTGELANADFDGYNLTVLDSVESDPDDWDDESLTVTDAEFDAGDVDYVVN